MIYGVDLHPGYQAGISIPQIKKEGLSFVICKMSQGTSADAYRGSIPWLNQARDLGMPGLGYHYLTAINPKGQAQTFVKALESAGVPGAIDVEKGSGDIDNIRTFYAECQRLGANIPLLYLPSWYWEQIGKPSLKGLPPLWRSRYPDMELGTPAQNYSKVPATYWDGYGGLPVALLQYTSSGRVAGHTVDCNAFKGDLDAFKSLINISTPDTFQKQEGFLMALNDAEQAELLAFARAVGPLITTIDIQLRGQKAEGWPTWQGGTGENLTLVDYMRRNNVEMQKLRDQVAALTGGTGGNAPDAVAIETAFENVISKLKLNASLG
jgi:GH25 family lysozyme M1 (1,4-beta-N-acetylmuramidase)